MVLSLFLDGTAEPSEVLAKSVIGINGPFGEIFGQVQLAAQGVAGTNSVGLGAFALPDGSRGFQQILRRSGFNKNAAVVIGEHEVAALHFEITEAHRAQGVSLARIEPLRTGGTATVTPNRKANLSQLRSIAMRSPDDDRGQAR